MSTTHAAGAHPPAGVPKQSEGSLLRKIPAVDELLRRPEVVELQSRAGRNTVAEATREVLQDLRNAILRGEVRTVNLELLESRIAANVEAATAFSLAPVINATGVVLHTNLGRAPLSREALERVQEIGSQYSTLEYEPEPGARGKRDLHTDRLLARLLGSEASLVVNNNAAAVFLMLNTLAEGGEVLVSRSELIEIGGSFRIPDIMAKSGAQLREVGTTNRTRISDYERAVDDRVRLLLRVHPSNFRIVGFTERPVLAELVDLGRRHGLPVMEDLGSGALRDLQSLGIPDEPTAPESIRAGVDVISFSGDKLLGGPQAGIIAGKRSVMERARKNPLFRALRVDKMTLAALETTLAAYLRGDAVSVPVQKMIHLSCGELEQRVRALAQQLDKLSFLQVEIREGESVIGGGSTPGQSLPTRLLSVSSPHFDAAEMAAFLRRNRPPIIPRVERERLLLDLRTVLEGQAEQVAQAFGRLAEGRRSV